MGQNSKEVRVTEHGEITNRYNTAITNLGSRSPYIRMGGVYALDRIMHDSSRDERAIIPVLSEYVHKEAPHPPEGPPSKESRITVDVQAALSVIGDRPTGSQTGDLVDLNGVDLRGLQSIFPLRDDAVVNLRDASLNSINLQNGVIWKFDLTNANLESAKLSKLLFQYSNLTEAGTSKSDLSGSTCDQSDLTNAILIGANLRSATLGSDDEGVDSCILRKANLSGADLTKANLDRTNLEEVNFTGANLTQAKFVNAKMHGVILSTMEPSRPSKIIGVDFTHADLRDADLRWMDLSSCDLRGADLRGAQLDGAKLKGANLEGARGVPAGHE
ncbi:pentapeptide repeat-containing protein [Streptomyces abikoensis]|uniref:Pentapeptide repeat-containing protein n=1 Tax=Streptomyces abikoensis TaxID=97398 RepID=A0ABW7TEU3_9ACTN